MRVINRLIVILLFLCNISFAEEDNINIIRDAEVNEFLYEISKPIFGYRKHINQRDFSVAVDLDYSKGAGYTTKFFVVDDGSINAFVSGGRNVFVNSGLLTISNNSDVVFGVLAHEFGHLLEMHLARSYYKHEEIANKSAVGYSIGLMSLLTGGIALPLGTVLATSQLANLKSKSYSREFERSADAAAMRYIEVSHRSGAGLMDVMKYFASKQSGMSINKNIQYLMTHPIAEERLKNIERYMLYEDKMWIEINPKIEHMFQRVKAKMEGFLTKSEDTIDTKTSQMPKILEKNIPFYQKYKTFFQNFKAKKYEEAITIGEEMLKSYPGDLYISESLGQLYQLVGNYDKSIEFLDYAYNKSGKSDIIAVELCNAILASDKKELFDDASKILYKIHNKDKNDIDTRMIMSKIYQKMDIMSLKYLMDAEIAFISKNYLEAFNLGKKARDECVNDVNKKSWVVNYRHDIDDIIYTSESMKNS